MKTKALVLGALSYPFEGTWVQIGECENWRCRLESIQDTSPLCTSSRIDVQLSNGTVIPVPLGSRSISGFRARFVLESKVEGLDGFCVYLEEVILI